MKRHYLVLACFLIGCGMPTPVKKSIDNANKSIAERKAAEEAAKDEKKVFVAKGIVQKGWSYGPEQVVVRTERHGQVGSAWVSEEWERLTYSQKEQIAGKVHVDLHGKRFVNKTEIRDNESNQERAEYKDGGLYLK